ncbi:hypothetical protein LEP1GSC170_5974 [Leptospira interrogans serovar Bataviae str. HAI135]|nr:hypothetical protein LEP1GSC170_5974 [Leptospira interrogans serovar Bataviae str. HAI135]
MDLLCFDPDFSSYFRVTNRKEKLMLRHTFCHLPGIDSKEEKIFGKKESTTGRIWKYI